VAGGFAVDEAYNELGTHLLLPPWFEERRDEIEAMLEPIQVPETNWPAGAVASASKASHRNADFVPPADKAASR
jgi:glyoxalase family protein